MNSLLFEIDLASFEKRRKKMIGYKNIRATGIGMAFVVC
jgi:hypothetical protein